MILITGGAGYIGSHANKKLHTEGVETVVVDNLDQGHREMVKWGIFEEGDIKDEMFLEGIFDKYKIEAVMHFAAASSVPESIVNPEKFYLNNVGGTLNLLKVMNRHKVNKLIFSSTAATFGNPEYTPMDENHPQTPITPYGRSKYFLEKIYMDYQPVYDLKFVAFRYFNACGDDFDGEIGEWHEPEGHLIPLVLDAALGKRDCVKIFGTDYETRDGSAIRDYIHVSDLADIHYLALKKLLDGGDGGFYNLGDGKGFTVKEIIAAAKEVTGIDFKVEDAPRREGDPPILVATSDKVRKEFNWEPKYSDLKTIIETAWKWHQKLYKEYKKV
jgi:UDP-glucose 4-epimerase